jgi:hypothetical protein
MKFMKKECMIDFKKVYSEVLNINHEVSERIATNFDIKISKKEAEFIIQESKQNDHFK